MTICLYPIFLYILFDANIQNSDLIDNFLFYTQRLEAVVWSY